MKALIDGDIIVYSCGFASDIREWTCPDSEVFTYSKDAKAHCEKHGLDKSRITLSYKSAPISHAFQNVKQTVQKILDGTGADDYTIFLTGKGNYRHDVKSAKPYKGNRNEAHKPTQYKEIIEFLKKNYNTVVVDGQEADDAMGIEQTQAMKGYNPHIDDKPSTVICTKDKDLNCIAGLHYNWTKEDEGVVYINDIEAWRHFYKQCLTGDRTDNIDGIYGIGDKKADKILADCTTPKEMLETVMATYDEHGMTQEQLVVTGMLLWIRREEDELWNPLNYL